MKQHDLTTARGRYLARQSGLDVPLRRAGVPPRNFDSLVKRQDGDGCWEWTGDTIYGYGKYNKGGKSWRAHRYAWELANGPIPDGLVVMHLCDNRRCVRLSHLRLGTNADNMRDAALKRRMAHGERASRGKLTEKDVLDIRASHRPNTYSGEWTTGWIAKRYGIHVSTVRYIVRGEHWKYAHGGKAATS